MTKARLYHQYKEAVRNELKKKFDFANIMEVPAITKVVINVGVKEAVADSRVLQHVTKVIRNISGQNPVITKAKKSIAGFKIREGMPLGVTVTLRKNRMYEFLDRLINVALPNVRDFRGVTPRFDRRGNYNLGIKEWTIFPEAEGGASERVHGLNISVCTNAVKDEHAYALLESFKMPFRTADKK